MTRNQAERTLQQECAWRLNALPVAWCAVPNGVYIPARTEEEKILVARIVKRMQADGQMVPGAADLVVSARGRCLWVELKRGAERDLLGLRHRRGQLSTDQKAFRERCQRAGAAYIVATSWDEVEAALYAHGLLERREAA